MKLMSTQCPNGHPSGPFEDPRATLMPGAFLGNYYCVPCHNEWPMIDILRKQDERDLEAILDA